MKSDPWVVSVTSLVSLMFDGFDEHLSIGPDTGEITVLELRECLALALGQARVPWVGYPPAMVVRREQPQIVVHEHPPPPQMIPVALPCPRCGHRP